MSLALALKQLCNMEDNVYQNLDILLFINSLNLTRKLTVFAASYEGKFVLTLVVLLEVIL